MTKKNQTQIGKKFKPTCIKIIFSSSEDMCVKKPACKHSGEFQESRAKFC